MGEGDVLKYGVRAIVGVIGLIVEDWIVFWGWHVAFDDDDGPIVEQDST